MDESNLLDTEGVARKFKTSISHVRRLMDQGLPYLKLGHKIRFSPADVQQWLSTKRAVEQPKSKKE